MAFSVWPSGLPQRLSQQGYGEGLAEGRIKSQPEMGPAKVRLRSSAMPRPLAGDIRMSSAQIFVAREFVETDLLGGSLPFLFPEPLTLTPFLVRFVDMPSWNCVGGDWYDFRMSLEILP